MALWRSVPLVFALWLANNAAAVVTTGCCFTDKIRRYVKRPGTKIEPQNE
ncbi:hypothetical protein KD146_09525 [Devosia sp. BSSL-BM10]|uniref:Uncharacterized protein n=1 Tax=Devosia litorisediminis TaxID=2829817 RepID=A0A942E6I7_9HYPH|nr:hypothetical protein [Devosia litorisediminis]MBS3848930.1 hypothetical protein [Devosia litorisediminis]